MQAEAAGQTAATIPWSRYEHSLPQGPTYTNCKIDAVQEHRCEIMRNNTPPFINNHSVPAVWLFHFWCGIGISQSPTSRDWRLWPFSESSPWNQPIGSS